MKKSGTTTVFVLVCAVVLCASYAIGLCIREIRFRLAAAEPVSAEVQKTDIAKVQEPEAPVTDQQVRPERNRDSENDFGGPGFGGPGGGSGEGGPGRFENMTDEERTQMRERFANGGGRGGMGMSQMSEEDMQKFRSEMDDLRSKREEMSDEEFQQAMTQLREKYGMPSRGGFGGRGRRGGDRSNSGQQENTLN